MWFLWILWRWSLQINQLNKSPCRCKKKQVTKSEKKKKTHQFNKTWPTELVFDTINLYKNDTRYIILVTFCQKLSISWIYSWTIFLEVHWRFLQNIALQNPKKKLPISLNYVLESFPFTPYIFIKRYTWSINFETIH